MLCPKCKFEQTDGNTECSKCGIIFEKYQNRLETKSRRTSKEEAEDKSKPVDLLKYLLFHVDEGIDPLTIFGRLVLLFILALWGGKLISAPYESTDVFNSFMHNINLPFHEAGHVIFRPLGQFMMSLGGSLGQLIMPLICLITFLIKTKDSFAASVALWWFGENFLDLAPYINDARNLSIPLVGGNFGHSSPYGFHDWEYILMESGLLYSDHTIAFFSHKLGALIMTLSIVWGGYIVFIQYKMREKRG